tara:strand:+ start:806 stop:1111 length:306 start_codon:yes stop_codon:yes gene_type:complete
MYTIEIDGITHEINEDVFKLILKTSKERDYYKDLCIRSSRIDKEEEITFTHLKTDGDKWETTIFLPEDFESVEKLCENKDDGIVYLCQQGNGMVRVLRYLP